METNGQPSVELNLTYDGSSRILRVAIANTGSGDLFITTPLQSYERSDPQPDLDLFHVFARNETLVIAKMLWPIPDGLSVYRPELPLLSRIPAGNTMLETVVLPHTIKPRYPYMNAADFPPTAIPQRVEQITFQIGVVAVAGGTLQLEPVDVRGVQQFPVFRAGYGGLMAHQTLVRRTIDVQLLTRP